MAQVGEEHRAKQASHGKLDLVDLALHRRDQPHMVEAKLLAQPADILAIPCDTVQSLADYHIDPARAHFG
nr:hypothetical protein [Sphingomonas hankookensis]